ncbi:fumarylacetoacetate hydrolase family protein [Brachyspira innocens]|uniref:fumarylacetoacetate hydrolase family protein n=1 Tax=Brachyspira innocens TaxID=13264 RepID=UPI0026F1D7D9|nr:fumarylacetoacetate hydrolase family protein [Brachyspira innocens]
MKFVSFVEWNNTESIGILSKEAKKVIAINEIIPDFKANDNPMIQLIKMMNEDILQKLKYAEENCTRSYSIENVQILSPIRKPIHDIICVGVNYNDHLSEIKKDMKDFKEVKAPVYFSKRAIEIIGLGDKIKGRFDLDECLDYEVELAVIIGKTAKDIKEEEVHDYIFGYSIFNDISSRNIQKRHSQWYKGKSLDSYSAMGPCIVYKDDIKFPIEVKSILNDEIRQSSNTKYMIHNINYLVSDISKGMTLEAGDIIATGTPGGVGMSFNPPKYMKHGDKITCSIEGIGELINFVE